MTWHPPSDHPCFPRTLDRRAPDPQCGHDALWEWHLCIQRRFQEEWILLTETSCDPVSPHTTLHFLPCYTSSAHDDPFRPLNLLAISSRIWLRLGAETEAWFSHKLSAHSQASGTSRSDLLDIPGTEFLFSLVEGGSELFDTHPLALKIPTPPGGLRTRKSNLCFSLSDRWGHTHPSSTSHLCNQLYCTVAHALLEGRPQGEPLPDTHEGMGLVISEAKSCNTTSLVQGLLLRVDKLTRSDLKWASSKGTFKRQTWPFLRHIFSQKSCAWEEKAARKTSILRSMRPPFKLDRVSFFHSWFFLSSRRACQAISALSTKLVNWKEGSSHAKQTCHSLDLKGQRSEHLGRLALFWLSLGSAQRLTKSPPKRTLLF